MKNGYTPLDLCLFATRHKELMQLLVAKGADVNAQAASGAITVVFRGVCAISRTTSSYLSTRART